LGDKKPLNFSLNINKLSTKTIQPFSFGQMRRANGSLNGNITIKGANEQPDIAGFIGFEKVAFDVSQLGTKLLIDKQKIYFQNHEMEFKNFTLSDTLNQPLRVNGKVIFQNYLK
jgi:autotransporter translocation and assembly factor TamB